MSAFPMPTFSLDHMHPILVNFTAALVPASVGSDVLGRVMKRQSLHTAAGWMVLFAACVTPLTAITGLLWKRKVGEVVPQDILHVHQWLGISVAVLLVGLGTWRWKVYRRDAVPGGAYLAAGVVLVLALIYQGSLGGQMVFGS
jgi:uncharacterized membrane protein